MTQTILLIDDDRHITEALAMVLECRGRTVVVCNDVESAELALQAFDFTDVVSDVQFSGLFGFEGLHFIDRIRTRVPEARVVLMTGYASDVLRGAAAGYGATALLHKPFDFSELEAVIGRADDDGNPFEIIVVPSIDEIVSDDKIETVFQPIMAANDAIGKPYAYEALARVNSGWPLGPVSTLFEYASRRARSEDLNCAAIIAAIAAAATLPRESLLFLNVDPATFSDRRLSGTIKSAAARAGVALDRVVLEVTERCGLSADAVCAENFAILREAGVRFALDDHGSAFSHLTTIAMIRPSFIKISSVFGTGFETDLDKRRVVRNVLALARDFGCATVLEGIESQETATAAAALGIELAQGYFFSTPRDVAHWGQEAA